MKQLKHRRGNNHLSLLASAGLTILFTAQAQAQTYAPYVVDPFGMAGLSDFVDPVLVDLDNDGDLDIFHGTSAGSWGASFRYCENIGTPAAPSFAPGILDPFSMPYIGGILSPSFVDLDSDGDLDLMVGVQGGSSRYFENIGTASACAFAAPASDPFGLYSVGFLSSHTFTDLDNDGDQDVLIGEYYGNMYYVENIGTSVAPLFTTTYVNLPYGLTNVGLRAKPDFMDMDGDGDQDVLVGVENGSFYYFQNTGTVSAPAFAAPVLNPFGLTDVPVVYCAPTFGDLDFDGDLDIVAGDNSPQLKYFENLTPVPQPADPVSTTPVNLTVCNGTPAALTAAGSPFGTLGWYDAPVGGNFLGHGSPFTTQPLTAAATFYVQDSTAGGASAARVAVAVDVTQPVAEFSLSVQESSFCVSGASIILLSGTENGLDYSLRNDLNDTIVHGPVLGDGSSLSFDTQEIFTTTTYNVVVEASTAVAGGGSLLCLHEMPQLVTITVNQPVTATVTANICHGESYTYADGTTASTVTADESHVSTLAGQAANGCDSIVTENLISLPALTSSVTNTICAEEEIEINGTVYNATNPTGTEIFTGMNGCDSTVTINLTVLPALTGSVTNTICANEEIAINGTVYSAANPTGTEVLTAADGCDSTVTISLTVLPELTGSMTNTICANEEIAINGTVYNATNLNGTEVFTSAAGCDSTVTISLTVVPVNVATTVNGTILTADENGAVYQWIHCATNLPIDGATDQSFTATVNGSYAVIVTQNDCSDTSGCIAVTTIGLEEQAAASLVLYPNPAGASFAIKGLEEFSGIAAISVLDNNGKTVLSLDPSQSEWTISALATGMYTVRIVHDKGIGNIRLVKE